MTPKPSDTKAGKTAGKRADQIRADQIRADQAREVDANYHAFKALEPDLSPDLDGQYVVLRHGRIIAFYPDDISAFQAGVARFPDRRFSLQQVRSTPLDFGWFSHVAAGLFDKASSH